MFQAAVEGQSIALSIPANWEGYAKGHAGLLEDVDLYEPSKALQIVGTSRLQVTGVRNGELLTQIDGQEFTFSSVKRDLVPLTEQEVKQLAWNLAGFTFELS